MKTINFLLMDNKSVGKSTLLDDTYLWKLKYDCAYHDHTEEQIRYLIDVVEIDTLEELQEQVTENLSIKNIYFVCFNVTDRKTLLPDRNIWILELLKLKPNTKIFLVGLQCDMREQFIKKFTHDCVSYSDGVSISRYYENVQYMECTSNKIYSVRDLFDKAIEKVLYKRNFNCTEKIMEFYKKKCQYILNSKVVNANICVMGINVNFNN